MTRIAHSFFLCLLLILLFSLPLPAEVVMDGTMGTAGPLKGPAYEIPAEYGQQAGSSLFHSFQHFNIASEESATFSGPSAIERIISRVTGGDISRIDGLLQSEISGADLYLLNPSGIIFGPDASLNIGGSFHVSTADYLRLGDSGRFYSMPVEGELLSVEAPAAFGFLSEKPAAIRFEGSRMDESAQTGLRVAEGENISIVCGNVDMTGNYYSDESGIILGGTLAAPGGHLNMVSAASEGEYVFTENRPDISSFDDFGEIRISDNALMSISGEGSGNVFIKSGSFFMENSSIEADSFGSREGGITEIQADTIELKGSNIYSDAQGSGQGGDIRLHASESFLLSDSGRVFADATNTEENAGDAGNVFIESPRISIENRSIVSSDTYGSGQGGSVQVLGDKSVDISGESMIFTVTEGQGNNAGAAGSVLIESQNIRISEGSIINSDTRYGSGAGGSIRISGPEGEYAEFVTVDRGRIFSGAIEGNIPESGDGGTVLIKSGHISFVNGGVIGSESTGGGKGGDVTLLAAESLSFSGRNENGESSRVLTSAESTAESAGDAGSIFIEARALCFDEGSGISAATEGPGNAGIVSLKIESLEMDGGAFISSSSNSEGAGGNAGTVAITAEGSIEMDNGSLISTATAGQGNAGDISIDAFGLHMNHGSSVSSASTSTLENAGDAGTIAINITDGDFFLENDSSITTEAVNAGKGLISLSVGNNYRMEGSRITTSIAKGGNDAGDVYIWPPEWLIMRGSDIVANAYEGNGGNIRITSDFFIQSTDSKVDASSELGVDGLVEIDAIEPDIASSLVSLPQNFLDATQWAKTACAERSGESVSRFIFHGKDGIPSAQDDWLPGPILRMDGE